jgi:hypothetical protein
MTYLQGAKATGPVHVLAHSMGNVVAAESLRQWTVAGNAEPLVTNYVAMQGALSAGAYGDDARDAVADGSGHDYYRHWPSGFRGEGRYYMEGTDQAAGRWINMFNEVDGATSTEFGWGGNNRVKPLAGTDESLAAIPHFSKLEELLLAGTEATDTGLMGLVGWHSLRRVLWSDRMTVEGQHAFNAAFLAAPRKAREEGVPMDPRDIPPIFFNGPQVPR